MDVRLRAGCALFTLASASPSAAQTGESGLLGASLPLLRSAAPAQDLMPPVVEGAPFLRGFAVSFATSMPLRTPSRLVSRGAGTQGERITRDSVAATLKYSPRDSWFARVTFVRLLHPEVKKPWDPDFTYSFGYDNWRPGKFSLTYDNYGGNRILPRGSERRTHFDEGSVSLGFKVPVPLRVQRIFSVSSEGGIGASLGASVIPSWTDPASRERRHWKTTFSAGVRWTIWRTYYAEIRAYAYPRAGERQAWNPDFTYGFGSFDWRRGKLSVQYANYAGNRFPWRPKAERDRASGFRDGSLSASWGWSW